MQYITVHFMANGYGGTGAEPGRTPTNMTKENVELYLDKHKASLTRRSKTRQS